MTLAAFAAWIVNYQALAAAVLLVATLAGLFVRQPARRAVLDWATITGLLALAALSALPGWPRVALFERPAAELQVAQPVAPRVEPSEMPQLPPREFAPRFEPRPPRATTQPISAPLPAPAQPPAAPPSKPEPWGWSDLAAPLALAYLAGMGLVVVWLLWGAVESWRLVRRAARPGDELLATLASVAEGRSPRLLVSGDVSAAAALGALRPTILVTPQLAAAPADVVRAVLAHELAHLRHGDLWFLALGRAGLLLLYPQPLYWWLRRRAFDAREVLADAAAAGAADRTQYAELLVAAARTLSGPPRRGPALAILERPSQLGRRIKLLLDPRGAIELRSSRRWRWLGAAAAAVVVLAASLVQVMPAPRSTMAQADEAQAKGEKTAQAVPAEQEKPAEGGSRAILDEGRMDDAAANQGDGVQDVKAASEPLALAPGKENDPSVGQPAAEGSDRTSRHRPAEIDDRGALTYSGTVFDESTGRPIAGATVVVKQSIVRGENVLPIQETAYTTDASGGYRFTIAPEQIAKRQLVVTVRAEFPGYVAATSGGELASIRSQELLGVPPDFRRIELAPGDDISGQIVDPTGKPAADVPIRYLSVSSGVDGKRARRAQAEIRTDVDGQFRFVAVRGGVSRLTSEPRDFAPHTLLLGSRKGDVGRIQLEEGKRFVGTVLDSQDKPLPTVWVSITPKGPPFAPRPSGEQWRRAARTDEQGKFALEPLRPGDYQAHVADRAWGESSAEGAAPRSEVFVPELVTLSAEAPTTEITLRPVPHVQIEAEVVNAAGTRIATDDTATIHVEGRLENGGYCFRSQPVVDGRATVRVPRGLLETRLWLSGQPIEIARKRRTADRLEAAGAFELGKLERDVNGLQFVCAKQPTMIARAVDHQGQLIPDAKPRIDYPEGTVAHPNQRWPSGVEGQVYLGIEPDGSWHSVGLLPNRQFTLTMQAEGYRSASKTFELGEGATEEVRLRLEPSAPGEKPAREFSPPEQFRLVWDEGPMDEETANPDANVATPPRSITRPEDLSPQGYSAYRPGDTPPASSPTTLFGVVTDDQGQPLPGVKVDAWHWFAGNETTTDSNGRFELSGFEPHEPLEIVFTKEGFSPLLRTGVKAGTLLEATLDDKTSVVGTIRDPAGQPVVGAVVRASHEVRLEGGELDFSLPLDFETQTDAEGRYRLLVARGNFDLWARKPGVGISQRAFVLADPGRPETVDLQLEPGVRFEARLRDSLTGKPVVGAKLESQFADVQGVSDENGLAVFDALPRIELAISVDSPGYARWWSPQSSIKPDHGNPEKAGQWQDDTGHLRFELSAARLNAEIELEPAVTLRGRVVDPNGATVAGAALAANLTGQTDGIADNRFKTDAEGRFELHLPASGAVEYNLVAHDGDWRTSRDWANGYGEPLRTTPGQTLEGIELRLTRGATIRGRVVDRQGEPVAGKDVVAQANHARAGRHFQPRAVTDAAGRFELKNVEGGSNTIVIEGYRVPEEGPPGSWRRIEVKPGDDVELSAGPPPAASGPFFRVGQGYVDSVDGRIERAAEAFQIEAEPR